MSKDKATGEVCPVRKTSIGGQALMEGIMMRGPRMTAMAVRNPDGEMVIEKFPNENNKKSVVRRIPIIRGIFNFADSMIFGYKCLMRSAEISGLEQAEAELEQEKAAKKAAKAARKKGTAVPESVPSSENQPPVAQNEESTPAEVATPAEMPEASPQATPATEAPTGKAKKSGMSPMMVLIMVISVVLVLAITIGLFVYLPTLLYDKTSEHITWMQDNRYAKSVFTGILKVLLLVGYMAAISLMKDIRRTFQYHGAEHKTIFCYEKGLPLTVENVRLQKRFHPRCGTSFLILMVLVSILVGFLIPPSLPTVVYAGIRILLVPVIVGLGYELIKFCGRHDNRLTRMISAPGVALQHITVFEPDDSMIECAIAAINQVIPNDGSDAW